MISFSLYLAVRHDFPLFSVLFTNRLNVPLLAEMKVSDRMIIVVKRGVNVKF